MPECVLHKWSEKWQLPSSDPGCMQVEAWLRLSGTEFTTVSHASPATSISDVLPAVEVDGACVAPDAPSADAAAAILRALPQHRSTPGRDPPQEESAEARAFSSLIRTQLEPALTYCTWVEPLSFRAHTRKLRADGLPWPLSRMVPWDERRAVCARFSKRDAREVMQDAVAVLGALEARFASLESRGGPYFFGAKSCSVDALLLGVLLALRGAPTTAPVLRNKLETCRHLVSYLEELGQQLFGVAPPVARAAKDGWSSAAMWGGTEGAGSKPKQDSEELVATKRGGYWWLSGAAAVFLCYGLLSGRYVAFDEVVDEEDD